MKNIIDAAGELLAATKQMHGNDGYGSVPEGFTEKWDALSQTLQTETKLNESSPHLLKACESAESVFRSYAEINRAENTIGGRIQALANDGHAARLRKVIDEARRLQ